MFDYCPCFVYSHDSIDDSMKCYNCIYFSKCDFDDDYLENNNFNSIVNDEE